MVESYTPRQWTEPSQFGNERWKEIYVNEIGSEQTRPLTVNEWFLTILILALPLVNLVMYFYWAFADGVNLNKRNFCRASLLWAAIGLAIGMFFLLLGGAAAVLQNT